MNEKVTERFAGEKGDHISNDRQGDTNLPKEERILNPAVG
ncbi:hypothetical protein PAE4_10652 [Bacillus altitudinis]|nr:hypothetical protein PAE4_10652 [Bacillus altitudinis]